MNRSGLLQNYGKFCHAEFISSSNSFQNLTIKDPETSSGRQSSEILPEFCYYMIPIISKIIPYFLTYLENYLTAFL